MAASSTLGWVRPVAPGGVPPGGASTPNYEEAEMTDSQGPAQWNVAEWHGKMLIDSNGEKIGKLEDVYVDVETDQPQFATVKEGLIGRHLTFVPLGGLQI